MPDQPNNPPPPASGVWPPPPDPPNGPKVTTVIDGIEISRDNETLTLRNTRKTIPRELIIWAFIIVNYLLVDVYASKRLMHQFSGRHGLLSLMGQVTLDDGIHFLMPVLYVFTCVQAYYRVFTHFTFIKSQDTGYLENRTTVLCPVSRISHFRLNSGMTSNRLTLHLWKTTRKSFWDFPNWNRTRYIATFRDAGDAERAAHQLAAFADVVVLFR